MQICGSAKPYISTDVFTVVKHIDNWSGGSPKPINLLIQVDLCLSDLESIVPCSRYALKGVFELWHIAFMTLTPGRRGLERTLVVQCRQYYLQSLREYVQRNGTLCTESYAS